MFFSLSHCLSGQLTDSTWRTPEEESPVIQKRASVEQRFQLPVPEVERIAGPDDSHPQ